MNHVIQMYVKFSSGRMTMESSTVEIRISFKIGNTFAVRRDKGVFAYQKLRKSILRTLVSLKKRTQIESPQRVCPNCCRKA